MRNSRLIALIVALLAVSPTSNASVSSPPLEPQDLTAKADLQTPFVGLPLYFEVNGGQTDPLVSFLVRCRGYTAFIQRLDYEPPPRGSMDSRPVV